MTATVNQTPYYLASREQLLQALEAHVADMPADQAERTRITVLAFMDGDAARAAGIAVVPKPIPLT